MKIIHLVVDPEGNSKVETRGFSGGECLEASRFLEQALGARVGGRLRAEFYEGQRASKDQRQGQS